MTVGLHIRGIAKSFGSLRILEDISMSAPYGRITAVIGQNGAGKSTLFRIVMGLIRADAGSATLDGRHILDLPLHRKIEAGIGYLPQDCSSFPRLTVRQNLEALLECLPLRRRERRERAERLIEQTGLEDAAHREFRWLSRGEQRRLEIAKALVGEPRLLLMDEPLSGLDPGIAEIVIAIIRRLSAEGKGILLTDHNVHMTLPVTDYGFLLAGGRIVCQGTSKELAASSEARRLYFGRSFVPTR